jgi:hypothetical protein
MRQATHALHSIKSALSGKVDSSTHRGPNTVIRSQSHDGDLRDALGEEDPGQLGELDVVVHGEGGVAIDERVGALPA